MTEATLRLRFFFILLAIWPASAQQFVPVDQLARQDGGAATILKCPEDVPKLRFEVRISDRGEVRSAKAIKPQAFPVRYSEGVYRFLKTQAQKLVLGWKFRPMLVAGKPVPVRSIVTVPCQH